MLSKSKVEKVQLAVNKERLLKTAISLIEVPSPTLKAGAVADKLSEILRMDGFIVERPVANWPEAPAVVVKFETGKPGRTLQFDGHLDTVHLPFVSPRVEKGLLYGSGASDMKGGIAAFVEALRVLRETSVLSGGSILLTAHDHHEGPWGDKRQLTGLIEEGYIGDAVLLPEYLADLLPLAGRGMAIFQVLVSREGEVMHEVLRPEGLPDVVGAGVEVVCRLREMDHNLQENAVDSPAGQDSVFVGQVSSGEIYNQSPTEFRINGTRRWVSPGSAQLVETEFRRLLEKVAQDTGTKITVDFSVQADAFRVLESDPVVTSFQEAYLLVTGHTLSVGGKPFVDDGNRFADQAGIPVLTHGPAGKGAHTSKEWVELEELVRVAQVYALTAADYC